MVSNKNPKHISIVKIDSISITELQLDSPDN